MHISLNSLVKNYITYHPVQCIIFSNAKLILKHNPLHSYMHQNKMHIRKCICNAFNVHGYLFIKSCLKQKHVFLIKYANFCLL